MEVSALAVAFHLGPLAVHWYGILIAGAFLIAILGGARGVRRRGLNEDAFYTLVMLLMIAAVVGARAYYVAFEWPYYKAHPDEIVAVWQGGLAVHGGLLAGLLTMLIACPRLGLPFWTLADVLAPFMILGQGIGRWGNYLNGEAYGSVVDKAKVPWAIYVDGAWHHPTFLYESIWDVAGFFFLLWLGSQERVREGEVGLTYLMYYSFGRFFIEGLRTDSLMLGPLRIAQVMSLVLFSVALILLLWRRSVAKRSQ